MTSKTKSSKRTRIKKEHQLKKGTINPRELEKLRLFEEKNNPGWITIR